MKAKILVGIPTKKHINIETYASLPCLRREDVSIEIHYNSSVVLDKARNEIIEKFLEGDYTHLLFLDSDIILPSNILSLLDRDKAVVSGLYGIWKDGMAVLNVFNKTRERGIYRAVNYYRKGELIEIAACGLGCLLIKREVLEKIEPPWCVLARWDEEQKKMYYAEDFDFCDKIRRAGYKIYADTGVECGHAVTVDILEITNYVGSKLEREELIDELSEYTGLSEPEVRKNLDVATDSLANEWDRRKPKTEDDILSFYREADMYIYDLVCLNSNPQSMRRRGEVRFKLYGSVLDYGGGIGTYLIDAWGAGRRDLSYVDLRGKTWDFAEWRFKKRGISVKMMEPDELVGKYDCILLLDILEHIVDWKNVLAKLVNEHLNDNGALFITESFGGIENRGKRMHPMHFTSKKGELREVLDNLLEGRNATYYLWEKRKDG